MRRRGIAAGIIVGLATPTIAAEVLPVGGAFGDEAGCAFYLSGHRGSDKLAVLTPHTFTTDDMACRFTELESRLDENDVAHFQTWAMCGETGGPTARTFVAVAGSKASGYAVAIGGEQGWGPLALCPDTEDLFAPPGMQI